MAELESTTEADQSQQDIFLVPARFNERLIAFVIDAAPLGGAYAFVIYNMLDRLGGGPMRLPISAGFLAVFLLYETIGNVTGGTIGKRIMGLRVVRKDGQPLGFFRSLVRAFGYVLSTPVFNFGFVLALFHPENRSLHDLLAGSVVIEPRRKDAASASVTFLIAALLLSGLYFLIFWVNLYRPRPQDLKAIEDAKKGLAIMAEIEEAYRKDHNGQYTDQLSDLAQASGDPNKFRLALNELFNAKAGFKLQAGNRGYRIEGAANDLWRTRLICDGPPPRVRQVTK
jgi:uncharacterized RDD family membrane protein YckC